MGGEFFVLFLREEKWEAVAVIGSVTNSRS